MVQVGLIVRDAREEIAAAAADIEQWCGTHGHELVVDDETSAFLNITDNVMSRSALVQTADPIVTLGGDGTLIGAARFASGLTPVMIGVNYGRLGFLTEISPEEILSVLELVLAGKATTKTRSLIHCEVMRGDQCIFESQAVNDVVIQKGARDSLLDLDIEVDRSPLMRLRADGLIFSTPTGSTAYSLAAGGSIVYPSLEVVMLTPICPHSLTYRPIILPLDSTFTAAVPEYDGSVFVSVDGQVSARLEVGDRIRVSRSDSKVCFVRSPSRTYYEILRQKLNWGVGPSDS